MSAGTGPECETIIPYLLDELEAGARDAFGAHLETCSSCRRELAELREAWRLLPFTADPVEPPPSLKERVMRAALSAGNGARVTDVGEGSAGSIGERSGGDGARWWYGWVAAVLLLIALGAALWNNEMLRQETLALEERLAVFETEQALPARVSGGYTLEPVRSGSESGGYVWLLEQGETKRLVAVFRDLPVPDGDRVYQMWLIEGEENRSTGTFLVNERGRGLLVYPLRGGESFEVIRVTLEESGGAQTPSREAVLRYSPDR